MGSTPMASICLCAHFYKKHEIKGCNFSIATESSILCVKLPTIEFFSGNSGNSAISVKDKGLTNVKKYCMWKEVFSKGKI